MEAYAKVLNIGIPFFILLIIIEALVAKRMGLKINSGADAISSLSSGITYTIKELLGLTVLIVSYVWVVDIVAIIEIRATWLVYLIGFVGLDFASYWNHRFKHRINFLWNRHIIHHSSEEFNLSCALRTPISIFFSMFNLFLIPAAIFGVPGEVIAVITPLHFFAQFWYHTRLINKLGLLEYILVTPSHHRVHHAINPIYIDKNFGNIFIFWDKWFGTFQPELDDVEPVYGIKRPVKTWNPIIINFQHMWLLIKDAWRTNSYLDKLRIWFMPTGWRPEDVIDKYPIQTVENVFELDKYDSNPSKVLLIWSWTQLIFTLCLMIYFFNQFAEIGVPEIFVYGAFIIYTIFSYTALLDKSKFSLIANICRIIFGLSLIWWQGGWFGLDEFIPYSTLVLVFFFLGSFIIDGYIYFTEILLENRIEINLT